MKQMRNRGIVGILALSISLSGCAEPVEPLEAEVEVAIEEDALQESEQALFTVEPELYTYDSAYLKIDLELPVAKRGDRIDLNATRVLQKPFRDAINMELTNADLNAARNPEMEKRIVKGGYEVEYEDQDLVAVAAKPELGYMRDVSAVLKNSGQELTYSSLENNHLDWTTVGEYLLESGISETDARNRRNVLGTYYVTASELVFALPAWFAGTDTSQRVRIPLEALELNRESLIHQDEPVYQIGSKQHRVSTPYFTLSGEIPVFESELCQETAKELSAFIEEQVVVGEQIMEDDSKHVYESNKDAGFTYPPDVHNVQFDVMRNDASYVSFYMTYYEYTGGAHGNHYDLAYNIDTATGRRLELEDIFKMDVDYVSVLNAKIHQQIVAAAEAHERIYGESYNPYAGFESISHNQHFYLTDASLVLFFDLYEIAPYAAGIPMFEIPFSEIEDLMQ